MVISTVAVDLVTMGSESHNFSTLAQNLLKVALSSGKIVRASTHDRFLRTLATSFLSIRDHFTLLAVFF
jgi:hypothetical protein